MGILKDPKSTPLIPEVEQEQKSPDSIAKARADAMVLAKDTAPENAEGVQDVIKKEGTDLLDSLYIDQEVYKEGVAKQAQLNEALATGDTEGVTTLLDKEATFSDLLRNSASFYRNTLGKTLEQDTSNVPGEIPEDYFSYTGVLLEREAQKMRVIEEFEKDRYTGQTAIEIAGSVVPGVGQANLIGIAERLGLESDATFRGATEIETVNNWFNSAKTIEQQREFGDRIIQAIKDENESGVLMFRELDVATMLMGNSTDMADFDLGLDILTAGGYSLAKGVVTTTGKAITRQAEKSGIRKVTSPREVLSQSVKEVAPVIHQNSVVSAVKEIQATGTLAKNTLFDEPSQVVEELLPTMFKTDRIGVINYIPGRTQEGVIDRSTTFNKAVQGKYANSIYKDEENIAAVRFSAENLAKNLKAKAADFVILHDDIGSPVRVTALLGKKGTEAAFATEKAARAAATNLLGDDVAFEVVKPYGGTKGFMLSVAEPVRPGDFVGKLNMKKTDSGAIDRLLGAASSLLETNEFTRALTNKAVVKRTVIDPLLEPVNTLNTQGRRTISDALDINHVEDTWFTHNQFRSFLKDAKEPYSPELWKGYRAAREALDFEYMVRNSLTYSKLHAAGYKTVDMTASGIDSAFKHNFASAKVGELDGLTGKVYDMSKKKIVDVKDLDLAALKAKGYKKVEFYDDVEAFGEKFKYTIAPEASLKVSDLHPMQLGYRAGGARQYYPGGMVRYKVGQLSGGRGVTHTLTNEFRSGEQFVQKLTAAQSLYKRALAREADDVLAREFDEIGLTGELSDWSKVKAEFASGRLNPDSKFEIAAVKDDLPSVAQAKLDAPATFNTPRDPELDSLYDTGGLYWGKRGDNLLDVNGNKLARVDPLEAMDQSIRAVMNTEAFASYGQRAMKEWVNRFVKDKNIDLRTAFGSDPKTLGLSAKEERLARAGQAAIKRLANVPEERIWQETMERASYFLDDVGGKVGNKIAPYVFSVAQKDPVGALRSMAFHAFLGLGNVAQFALQSTQAIMISAVVKDVPFDLILKDAWKLRALSMNGFKDTQLAIAKHMDKGFKDTIDSAHFMRTYDRSGFGDIMNEHAFLDLSGTGGTAMRTDSRSVVGGVYQATTQQFSKGLAKGRYFFDQAEAINRGAAFSIAYRKLAKEKGTAFLDTNDGMAALVDMADSYNLRMLSSKQSAFQQGVLSIPTQFLSYSVRFMETILPQKIGGTTTLSAAEKGRLWSFAAVMSGTEGLPYATEAYDGIRQWAGMNEDPNYTIDKFIRNGMVDGLVFALSDGEANTSFGRRAAPIRAIVDTFKRFADPDTSFAEGSGGAALSLGNGLWDAAVRIRKIGETDVGDGEAYLEGLGKAVSDNISSMSNAHKAYVAYKTGELVSRNGNTIAKDITALEAVLLPLGFTPSASFKVQDNYLSKKQKDGIIDEAAKIVGREFKDAARVFDINDTTAYDDHMSKGEALLQTYDYGMQSDIRKKASYGAGLDFLTEELVRKSLEGEPMNPQEQLLLQRTQE
jgi:hypothetical protein